MKYSRFVISSGHGAKVAGASGIIDEVTEARRVVEEVAVQLRQIGATVYVYHDNTSDEQSENLAAICGAHNSHERDIDVSVHFNAFEPTEAPRGVEALYMTQETYAAEISAAIADAGGLIDRGAKYRSDLYFLNQTEMPAVLLEVCFVDSAKDTELYLANFSQVCAAIAYALAGLPIDASMPPLPEVTVSVQSTDGVTLRLLINGEEVLLGRDDG